MLGVVKGFQIDCNFTGQLGDLKEKVTSQAGKRFTGRGPDRCWTHQRNIQQGQEQTEKGTQGCSVLSIDGPLGYLIGIGDQSSGKVVLVRGVGHAKETASTESKQPE